jgi:maleate isomerase
VPFVTPSIAVLAGLKAIGEPRRIAVLTPYWPPADTVIMEFFAACGYQVVGAVGLKAAGPTAVARITPDEIRAGFRAADSAQADVLVHVGTNLPVSAITEDIERTHGKPLIGVNVATYWQALRRIGVEDRIPGFGQLLATH